VQPERSHQRRSRAVEVLLTALIVLGVAVVALGVASIVAYAADPNLGTDAETGAADVPAICAGLAAWLCANVLLLTRAYPPGRRPWFSYTLFTLLAAIVATTFLAWHAVTRKKWAEAGFPSSGFKTCPDCAEPVRMDARVCRFCGYRFGELEPPA
jgi:uncharacterized protein UPF0547